MSDPIVTVQAFAELRYGVVVHMRENSVKYGHSFNHKPLPLAHSGLSGHRQGSSALGAWRPRGPYTPSVFVRIPISWNHGWLRLSMVRAAQASPDSGVVLTKKVKKCSTFMSYQRKSEEKLHWKD